MHNKLQETSISDIFYPEKTKLTKKDLIEAIKINEDDYSYIILELMPEIDREFCSLMKKYFNYTKDELLNYGNIERCHEFFIYKTSPLDFRKTLSGFNITNSVIYNAVHYKGEKIDRYLSDLCLLTDEELFYVLQSFIVRFYNLVTYLVAKQIKISNINEEYYKSQYFEEDFVQFMKFVVDHDFYELSIKRLDFISDANKFFKIKNLDIIDAGRVKGRDDILNIILAKLFKLVFYKVTLELNIQNKVEEANARNDTCEIIDELYDFFYRKIFIDMSHEQCGVTSDDVSDVPVEAVVVVEDDGEPEIYLGEDWGEE